MQTHGENFRDFIKEDQIKNNSKNLLSFSLNTINELKNDYLTLIRCTYPFCKCGKCISKSTKEKEILPNLKYGNISSTYNNQYIWKSVEKKFPLQDNFENNKKGNSNKSRFDNCFKEHLKSGLVSVMKNDYIPMQTEPNQQIIHKDNIEISSKSPFIGRSNYSIMFPGWQLSSSNGTNKKSFSGKDLDKKNEIAFTGKSSYQQNFERFEERYYTNDRASPILKKDNLEINGKLNSETTTKETYKHYDYTYSKNLSEKNKFNKNESKIFIKSNNYSKDSFLSSYERAFMLNNLSCKNVGNNKINLNNNIINEEYEINNNFYQNANHQIGTAFDKNLNNFNNITYNNCNDSQVRNDLNKDLEIITHIKPNKNIKKNSKFNKMEILMD